MLYKVKVFLDEFGVPTKATNPDVCKADVDYLLTEINSHPYTKDSGGFEGWTAWYQSHGWNLVNLITPTIWNTYYKPYV